MANSTTYILDEVENQPAFLFEAEKPTVIRQEAFIKKLGYQFRYNTVRDIFEYRINTLPWADMKERVMKMIRREFKLSVDFKGRGDCPTVNALYEIIDTDLMAPNFNPFEDFFKLHKWDGVDRMKAITDTVKMVHLKFGHFTLADVWPSLFKRWMIAAVQCTLGIKENQVMMLLFSEGQGLYKTTWLNNLCPPFLADYIHCGHINPQLTDNITSNILAEKIIANIDDYLDRIMYKDFAAMKSLVTVPFVSNRKSFRRDENKRPRRANFVGSVNNRGIFKDDQNRRYLTFEIEKIAWQDAQKIDINQLWLQAYHLYKNGERNYFDKNDEAVINTINNCYLVPDPEHEFFVKLFSPSDDRDLAAKVYTFSEIFAVLQKASNIRMYQPNLTVALKRLGIKAVSKRHAEIANSQPRWVYFLHENFLKEGDRILPKEEPTEFNLKLENSF